MKRKKIIGYKVRIRGDLKIEEDIYMIVWETVIKLPITPYKYVESFVYFTRINNEIVIKIDTNKNNYEIIKWNEYMKYRMMKFDKTNIKSWYEENRKDFNYEGFNRFGYSDEENEYFKNKPFIKFSSFIPYSEKFEILFTKYNKEIKEQDKIKINILGIEEIIGVTKSRYEFYKKLFTNFE